MRKNSAQTMRKVNNRPKREEHFEEIRKFLYDEGPHTAEQIGNHIGLTKGRALELLNLMKDSGEITSMMRFETNPHRPKPKLAVTYWILSSDV